MRRVDLIVGEGATEIAVARRLMDAAGVDRTLARMIDKGGQGSFWRDIGRYVCAANAGFFVFALADLESAACPTDLLQRHVPNCSGPLVLRIAVRATEAWLLADRDGIARWLRIAPSIVPREPDLLPYPKRELVQLARRSPVRRWREALVPEPGSRGVVGRGYLPAIEHFVHAVWMPERAGKASGSLLRALRSLKISN